MRIFRGCERQQETRGIPGRHRPEIGRRSFRRSPSTTCICAKLLHASTGNRHHNAHRGMTALFVVYDVRRIVRAPAEPVVAAAGNRIAVTTDILLSRRTTSSPFHRAPRNLIRDRLPFHLARDEARYHYQRRRDSRRSPDIFHDYTSPADNVGEESGDTLIPRLTEPEHHFSASSDRIVLRDVHELLERRPLVARCESTKISCSLISESVIRRTGSRTPRWMRPPSAPPEERLLAHLDALLRVERDLHDPLGLPKLRCC